MQQCAATVKKLSLELGGNAPFIVFDDADIEAAVKGAIASKYRNAGQTCVCANRILVQDGVYDAFTQRLAETAGAMKVADGFEPGSVIGPLIDMKAVEKVEAHIADAVKKGAKMVTGGKRAAQGGSFFEPTVLTDVTIDMVITREETFGPVDRLYRFKTEADAIKMANDTEFGLASYFYSRDIGRIWRVAEALEYGIVGINEGIISTEIAPFGGMKESGIGPNWRFTGAQNTASRNSSKSNTSAWAASTDRQRPGAKPRTGHWHPATGLCKSEADAIKMANDTEFGLAPYFYSRDIGRIWRVAEALEYGIVGINEGIISTAIAPFGGMKESASAAKARNTASRNSSKSNTSAWAPSIVNRARRRGEPDPAIRMSPF
jgi:acyl-CoA reductase-like NAD-dependent aldehyde dehydrogenase